MSVAALTDPDAAFARYEAVRHRLPEMPLRVAPSRRLPDLSALLGEIDLFLLDGFGVLNVGATAIPGAVARIAQIRAAGARARVLTNAATQPLPGIVAKYRAMGFDFAPHEIVSSRDVAAAHLRRWPGLRWGLATAGRAGREGWPGHALTDDAEPFEAAGGFAFLSGDAWTPHLHDRLVAALRDRPRPLVVANPDLVAPREGGLTIEPGAWGHDAADRAGIAPAFFGKPFGNAFDAVLAQLGGVPPPERIAMVGDTLHTDVLGGAAAGLRTVLVTDHGLFAGRDARRYIERSGIVPDVVVPTT